MIPSAFYWILPKDSHDFLRGVLPFCTDQEAGVSERSGPAQVSTAQSGYTEIWISLTSVSSTLKPTHTDSARYGTIISHNP